MMKIVIGLAAAVALAGCSGSATDPPAPAAAPAAAMTQLSLADAEKLTGDGLDRPFGSVVIAEPVDYHNTDSESKIPSVTANEYGGEIGYVRNPGMRVAIITRTADGRALNGADREHLRTAAEKAGLKLWGEPKIPPKLGPDDKTRMVLRNGIILTDDKFLGTITTVIGFKTKEQAEGIKAYLGPGYSVAIAQEQSIAPEKNPEGGTTPVLSEFPWLATITFEGVQGLVSAEMDEFERLANAIGASYVTTYFKELTKA